MPQPSSSCRAVSLTRLLATLGVALLAGGCAIHGTVDPYPPRHAHGAPVAIPEGHLPPPGQCRIWYPERPAGQQPPPGDCRELQHRVPPGAYLIRG